METFKRLVEEANKSLKTADHLAYITFPLVKDIKLMVTITENLHIALTKGMEAILYYDRLYKRIPPYADNFAAKFEMFRNKSAIRYNFPREDLLLINDVKEIIEHRQKSPMEFIRKDKFVICSNNYRVKTIALDKVKDYIRQAKSFMAKVNRIYNQNDRRFTR